MTQIEVKDQLARWINNWRTDGIDDFLGLKGRIADGLSQLAVINAYAEDWPVGDAMLALSEYNRLLDDLLAEHDPENN